MQKIHFTVFSQAYYVDMDWGFGCPSGGIKRMGDIFHHYDIPVTWLVSPKSARCEQEMFKDFHENYGDEIAMMIRFNKTHHANERRAAEEMNVEQCRKVIRLQKNEIESYLPWADIKVAGQGIRTNNILKALELEGFIGLFGHCYCQIGTDSITDFGMPWGSFPIRNSDYHLPASAADNSGIIAFEWTMRDLNRSFHTIRPELWSTDPNDVERGGVCTDDNVEWWKHMYMEYEKALPLNKHGIWFQFHQEAHEMTWGEVCKPFTEDRVIFTSDMQDEFLDWLTERESVEFMTASQAAELYRQNAKGTIPMCVPYKWTGVPDNLPFWQQVREKTGYSGSITKHAHIPTEELYEYLDDVNTGDPIRAMKNPPWIDSFFYFDEECQLVFDKNREYPIAIMNYLNYVPDEDLLEEMENEGGGGAPGFYLESNVPVPEISEENTEEDDVYRLNIKIILEKQKPLPYGLFLWIKIPNEISVEVGNVKEMKRIENRGIFLRMNLEKGVNKYKLTYK